MSQRHDPYADVLADCPAVADGCRYAAADTAHECLRNTGAPIRDGDTCFYEARAQVLDQREAADLPRHVEDPEALDRIADALHGPTFTAQEAS